MTSMPGFSEYIEPLKFLTITQLITASRCLRKFFYQTGCRLESLGGNHPAMIFGEAIHAAVPHAGHENNLSLAIDKFLHVWKGTNEDDKRNSANGIAILENFNLAHAEGRGLYELLVPPSTINVSGRVSDYEIPFVLEIPELSVPLLGRIDGLCKRRDNGEIFVLEYKTYSKGPYNYNLQEALETHIQGWGYVLAARTYGIPVRGVMYETIMVDKKERKLDLKPVYISDWNLEDFVQWVQRWGRAVLECERLQNFPLERTGCNSYSHYSTASFTCDFKNLCAAQDWTKLRGLYNRGKQHLPFTIPDSVEELNLLSSSKTMSEIAASVQKDRDLDLKEQTEQTTITNEKSSTLLINGKPY